MTTITTPRALLEQALEALELRYAPGDILKIDAAKTAIRAELAKPEQKKPITLDQFRAIANRTATTYRNRSDPEKSSYAFVDGSSLDDFWRKVCEAIQPTSAWHDAPTCAGLWTCQHIDDFSATIFNDYEVANFVEPVELENCRWYGPIPQDKEGNAA